MFQNVNKKHVGVFLLTMLIVTVYYLCMTYTQLQENKKLNTQVNQDQVVQHQLQAKNKSYEQQLVAKQRQLDEALAQQKSLQTQLQEANQAVQRARQLQLEQEKQKETQQAQQMESMPTLASRSGMDMSILPHSQQSGGNWMSFIATWYSPSGGTGSGRTATGTSPRDGWTIAVDPNVIPLGSLVQIRYPDGSVQERKAEDTGGAIRGNIIDVYSSSNSYCLSRGRQQVQVRILH